MLLFRKLSTWPVFGCLGPVPYWLIEAAFGPSTTTLSLKLIFLCQYRLKEQSLFIVFLETTSKLITFSQRSIKLLVGILFEFFTPAKLQKFKGVHLSCHIALKLATLPEYSLFVVKSSSLIKKKLDKFNGAETKVVNGRVL